MAQPASHASIDLETLGRELPPFDTASELEIQARGILRILLEAPVSPSAPIAADPMTCPNCGTLTESTRSPYCSEACRETAGFVRQFRAGLEQGWLLDPEKQVALGQSFWHLAGGGRPLRQHIVLPRAKEQVIKRDGGLCPCGKPATMVDHLRTACNRPINLRAVCEDCNTDRPFGDPAVLSQETFGALVTELATRIASASPIRACDNADDWDWRAYLAKRKAALAQ